MNIKYIFYIIFLFAFISGCGGQSSKQLTPLNQPHRLNSKSIEKINTLSKVKDSPSLNAKAIDVHRLQIEISNIYLDKSNTPHTQFFLNVDNNPSTGFSFENEAWDKAGADYMVEDNSLYKSMSDGSSWDWKYVREGAVTNISKDQSSITINLNKSDLQNLGDQIRVGFTLRDRLSWEANLIHPTSVLMSLFALDFSPPQIDTIPPLISNYTFGPDLNSRILINGNFTYRSPVAEDNVDGVISDKVIMTTNMVIDANGKIDASVAGVYFFKYEVSDSSGNISTLKTNVEVIDPNNPNPNGLIVVDGFNSDWKTIPNSSQNSIDTLKIKDMNGNLYILIDSSSIRTNTQLFIDTDNNSATGYQFFGDTWSQGGADYMVENTDLSSAKENSTAWAWDFNVGDIEYARRGNILEIGIPKNLLKKLGTTLKIGFVNRDENWNVMSVLPSSNMTNYSLSN